jgi:hypothetical protein
MHCICGYPITLLTKGLHQCNHPLENALGIVNARRNIVNARRNGRRSCGAGLWSYGAGRKNCDGGRRSCGCIRELNVT